MVSTRRLLPFALSKLMTLSLPLQRLKLPSQRLAAAAATVDRIEEDNESIRLELSLSLLYANFNLSQYLCPHHLAALVNFAPLNLSASIYWPQ